MFAWNSFVGVDFFQVRPVELQAADGKASGAGFDEH